jgi:hypothetical protein
MHINKPYNCACATCCLIQAWSELDPSASQYIPAVELSSLLRELPPPMGVRGEEGEQAKIQSIIMSVDIPIRKKNKVR